MANQIKVGQVRLIEVEKNCYTCVIMSLSYSDWLNVCRVQGWHVSVISNCQSKAFNANGDLMSNITGRGLPVFYSK